MNKNTAAIIGTVIILIVIAICAHMILEGQKEIKAEITSLKKSPGVALAANAQPVPKKNEIGFRPSYKTKEQLATV